MDTDADPDDEGALSQMATDADPDDEDESCEGPSHTVADYANSCCFSLGHDKICHGIPGGMTIFVMVFRGA